MLPSLLLCLATLAPAADAPKPSRELLWPKGAPGALGTTAQDQPAVTIWLPPAERRTGTGVVICPGGGYRHLALGHEGKEIAEWLIERGIAAFVLEYRLGPRYRHPVPLQDAQRAVRLVRARAKEFAIDSTRVGIWGFSAGGHLASTAITKFDRGNPDAADPLDRPSCRPDFAILCYPVITFEKPHAHLGSRQNLLGNDPDAKLVESLCNHKQVTKDTPPTFLFHTKADKAVPVQNSEMFYKSCLEHGVPARLVLYDNGPHGVGLARKLPEVRDWPVKLEGWLRERKLLPAAVGK